MRFTPREREVMLCLYSGLSYAKAAEQLGCAPQTVRVHVNNIAAKLPEVPRGVPARKAVELFIEERAHR